MTITAQSRSGKVSPPHRLGVTSNRRGRESPARPVDPSQPQPLGPRAPWGWNVTTPTVRNVSNVGGMPLLALVVASIATTAVMTMRRMTTTRLLDNYVLQ